MNVHFINGATVVEAEGCGECDGLIIVVHEQNRPGPDMYCVDGPDLQPAGRLTNTTHDRHGKLVSQETKMVHLPYSTKEVPVYLWRWAVRRARSLSRTVA